MPRTWRLDDIIQKIQTPSGEYVVLTRDEARQVVEYLDPIEDKLYDIANEMEESKKLKGLLYEVYEELKDGSGDIEVVIRKRPGCSTSTSSEE